MFLHFNVLLVTLCVEIFDTPSSITITCESRRKFSFSQLSQLNFHSTSSLYFIVPDTFLLLSKNAPKRSTLIPLEI